VYIADSTTTSNTVDANYIGLNISGTAAIPNGWAGIAIFNAANNSIGSASGVASQFISGNTREGIYIQGASGTRIAQSTSIGVAADQVTPLGNSITTKLQGIMLNGAVNSVVNALAVSNNGGAGIAVVGTTAINNNVEPITDTANGGLPIDLGNDGFTPNGTHSPPGPNNWLGYPVITASSATVITGTTCANCWVWVYRALGNPAAPKGGIVRITGALADGSGIWHSTLPVGLTRWDLAVQADQSPLGGGSNTSEVSPLGHAFAPILIRS
jgi:hypothetical protein